MFWFNFTEDGSIWQYVSIGSLWRQISEKPFFETMVSNLYDVTIQKLVKAMAVISRYFNGLVQDCSNSIANALELLPSYTKPSV